MAESNSMPDSGAPSAIGDVLDLDQLQRRCMGNLDLVQKVLDKFQKVLPEELAELESLFESGDMESVARKAHRIKGTSANVSAMSLQRAAAEIEQLGREGNAGEIPNRIQQLRDEWSRYVDCTSSLFSLGGR